MISDIGKLQRPSGCYTCTEDRYATHCVSPCLALMGRHAEHVVCHGSGRIDGTLIPKYGSPFAIESATFKVRDCDVCADVTRSWFNTARQYRESFDVYGSKQSFVWQQVEDEEPVIHTKSTRERPLSEGEIPKRVKVPDYAHRLPESIRAFTQPSAIQDAEHLSFLQGGRTWGLSSASGSCLPDGLPWRATGDFDAGAVSHSVHNKRLLSPLH